MGEGAEQHKGSILASHLIATGSILGIPIKNSFNVAEIYNLRRLEETGQRLDNVDRIHLVLAS